MQDQDQDQDDYLSESHLCQQYPGGLQVLDEAGLTWQQEDDWVARGPDPGGAEFKIWENKRSHKLVEQ